MFTSSRGLEKTSAGESVAAATKPGLGWSPPSGNAPSIKEGLVTDFFTRETWRAGKKSRLRKRMNPYAGRKTAPAAFLEAAKQTQFRPRLSPLLRARTRWTPLWVAILMILSETWRRTGRDDRYGNHESFPLPLRQIVNMSPQDCRCLGVAGYRRG